MFDVSTGSGHSVRGRAKPGDLFCELGEMKQFRREGGYFPLLLTISAESSVLVDDMCFSLRSGIMID